MIMLKRFGRKRLWSNQNTVPMLPWRDKGNPQKIQDSCCPGQDSNRVTNEYELSVTATPTYSMFISPI
jgi:hypothetical protein